MAKSIGIQAPPQITAVPRVDFVTPDFDVLVWEKGLNVVIEKALPCPCSKRTKEYQASCMNCQGTGWVYINPIKTRAIVQSINKSTRYKEWSAELVGTVALTVQAKNKLTYMDKITLIDSESLEAEVVLVRAFEDHLFSYTIYPISSVDIAFLFVETDQKLQVLINGVDFNIIENKIVYLNTNLKEGDSISIRYLYKIQYNVLDLNHDSRNSYQQDSKSRDQIQLFPISAIARKSHYIMDSLNYTGTNIFDNSVK